MEPREGVASLDNRFLVGGSSLEEVGLCGRLCHPSLLENHLLLERTPALGSGRIAREWGLPSPERTLKPTDTPREPLPADSSMAVILDLPNAATL